MNFLLILEAAYKNNFYEPFTFFGSVFWFYKHFLQRMLVECKMM